MDVKKRLKIPFQWVVFDAFYGRALSLLADLDNQSITFVAQIPSSHHIYLKDFTLQLTKPKSTRGRKAQKAKPNQSFISVETYAQKLRAKDWKKITIRTSSKGELKSYFHRLTVWLFDEQAQQKYKLSLLIRKDLNGDISYHLTNSKVHLQRLPYMQGQRYFVERAFQDAKQHLGLDNYQVRGI